VRFHVRYAVNRRCDLLHLRFGVRQESRPIFCSSSKLHTKSHVRHQIAAATPNRIYDLACDLVSSLNLFQLELEIAQQIAQQITTRYRMLCVNGSNSVSDTKSQMQQIASAIYSKLHMKSHTCNQPLRNIIIVIFIKEIQEYLDKIVRKI
jgi:hypothetical protein